ncbi:hypothetical protein ACIBFB_08445 [Nocardiopsis sp. NPDC050513]|uniref:hypothetical protein n=1 Tax=Nocardiopsis sp. NPDC050513 TaxID=3364338 RepID=UPI00379E53AF
MLRPERARGRCVPPRAHRLLRQGLDLDDAENAVRAIAYGFSAAAAAAAAAPPLPRDDARSSPACQADRLAEVIRRSREPATPPAVERYAAAPTTTSPSHT